MDDIASIYLRIFDSLLDDLKNIPWWPIASNNYDFYTLKPKSSNHRKKFLILSKKKRIMLEFKNA